MVYDKLVLETFLNKQTQLYDERVCETIEEADEFLDDCCAVVCKNKKEVVEYMEEEMDVSGMSQDEILAAEEVFSISDGRYLIVEG